MPSTLPLGERLHGILRWAGVPSRTELDDLVARSLAVLASEAPSLRPWDAGGFPGGMVTLPRDLPTILVPDLHARADFIQAVLGMRLSPGASSRAGESVTVLDAIERGELCLVFLGDAFHAERRAFARWADSYAEYLCGNVLSAGMDEEMLECLETMALAMELKVAFPRFVHFLKGNHENALNEEGRGNHPFGKFAEEGRMVRDWFLARYGAETLARYAELERALPICVSGARFVASHAEPARAYTVNDIVEARSRADVVEGLTWTGNGGAEEGSVDALLAACLPDVPDARYFAGHRPVAGGYALRANGRFVQIHDPDSYQVAFVSADRPFDFQRDLRKLD